MKEYKNGYVKMTKEELAEIVLKASEVKHGRWKNDVCTCCGIEAPRSWEQREYDGALQLAVYLYDYCPHCGAKMDLEEEEV